MEYLPYLNVIFIFSVMLGVLYFAEWQDRKRKQDGETDDTHEPDGATGATQ